ncbi:hypothetical protein G5B38_09935 [Pseudohalocynthiibacter aestuariivivens]|nr:SIR2 family protein [Pseudohalocynthiibacter aestuariivivens]QIE45819.1 hypothetical protein G5B38_09935 [Pseudohalocynthiibacter aestuariivivens]
MPFDRIFEKVVSDEGLQANTFTAPLLPVPKNRWDGLVYLHGLLPEIPTNDELNRLIISSGDFGLAYLTERWASRFVGELFRGYTVCFVGYSINDPILRYMMDALAADSLMGENAPRAFAFGNFSKGKEDQIRKEWEAKNVVPILYRTHSRHFYLHETLHVWAENYRDGVNGKQAIVSRYCQHQPVITTRQDNFVGRMNWALSDRTGLPAKHFAEFDPLPPLDWLEPFSQRSQKHADLPRFGVQPNLVEDKDLKFSLLNRPSPYTHSAFMTLVQHTNASSNVLDEVMIQMSRWLARHLNNPKLLLWTVEQGGVLHQHFEREVRQNLKASPPSFSLNILWNLLLSGRIQITRKSHSLYLWAERLRAQGLTASLRFELRDILAPVAKVSRPFRWKGDQTEADIAEQDVGQANVSDIVRWEIVLGTNFAHTAFEHLREHEEWHTSLPTLLPDATALLSDALNLMKELQGADNQHDQSYFHQPSIAPHDQNKDYNEWTALIDFARDAWLAASEVDPEAAKAEVLRWNRIPFPVFRRLMFFAITQKPQYFSESDAVGWLLSENSYWLWATETRRETIRLLVTLNQGLTADQSARLQAALVEGPPEDMFRADLPPEDLLRIREGMQWLLLAKWRASGAALNEDSAALLERLDEAYPHRVLAEDERDEFAVWSSNGEEDRVVRQAPRDPEQLQIWLEQYPAPDDFRETDDWKDICQKEFDLASNALVALSERGVWPLGRWRQALQVWSNDKNLCVSAWERLAKTVLAMPEAKYLEMAHGIAWWVKAISKLNPGESDDFVAFAERLFDLFREAEIEVADDVIGRAINHPVGLATEAVMSWWYEQGLNDDQGLQEEVLPLFDAVCDEGAQGLRYGTVVLAGNVITLFRVDSEWTKEKLLPFFRWDGFPEVAPAMWMSFLHSPRLYWPLLDELKEEFLSIPNHFEALGDTYEEQYLSLLTFAGMEPSGTFVMQDFKRVVDTLSVNASEKIANTLFRALQGAGDQRKQYFENRISNFFQRLWPKTQDVKTPEVSKAFAQLCTVSGDAFPEAVAMLRDWFQPVGDTGLILHLLQKSDLAQNYPAEVLDLLDLTIGNDDPWLSEDLKRLLLTIQAANPPSAEDARFQRLVTRVQQLGYGWP